jgi:hypothetical protein
VVGLTGGRLTLTPEGHSFAARENELLVVVEITGQKLTFDPTEIFREVPMKLCPHNGDVFNREPFGPTRCGIFNASN